MTAIGPYVVVFWTLSRLVLVRKGCDAAFLLYSQSNMVEEAVTCSWVPKSPGHHASRRQLSHQGSTRVQLEWQDCTQKRSKQASKLYPAGTVTRWLVYAGARDRFFNHVRLGIKEERCIAAFSDQNQSTQRPKDYNIWANRGHPCFYKNEMALLVTFCIQIPI